MSERNDLDHFLDGLPDHIINDIGRYYDSAYECPYHFNCGSHDNICTAYDND